MNIEIPTRPHLYKFLLAKFGQPYNLKKADYIGSWLFEQLRRPRSNARYKIPEDFTAIFIIEIDNDEAIQFGTIHCSNMLITRFNEVVTDLFNEALYHYMDGAQISGGRITYAASDFMAKYDIEDGEINRDSLLRKFRRHRQREREREKDEKYYY